MNKEYNVECLQVNSAITRLVDSFWKKYYWDDFQIEWIDREENELHYNLQINDEYWNIDQIYTALWFDVSKKILFEYKEQEFEKAVNKEDFMNLKTFIQINQATKKSKPLDEKTKNILLWKNKKW